MLKKILSGNKKANLVWSRGFAPLGGVVLASGDGKFPRFFLEATPVMPHVLGVFGGVRLCRLQFE